MATKKFHVVLTDAHGQKSSTTIEAENTVTAQSLATFLNTQTSAAITSMSEISTPVLTGMDVADNDSDVDDKIFLSFKSTDLQDVRKYVIAAPETGFKAAWLDATPQGLRVKPDKGKAFAGELSTALGLTGSKALIFTGGFYKHTK